MLRIGCLVCCLALVGASFARRTSHLIATQGVLYGLGFLILYYPLLSMLNEWFVNRRGFAYGLLFAANGVGGLGLPVLMQHLLARYGYATTLRGYTVVVIVLVGPALPLIRERTSHANDAQKNKLTLKIPTEPLFWTITMSSFFQGLAFTMPYIYLPSYAATLKIASSKAVLLLVMLNLTTILGQLIFGHASDRVDVHIPLLTSTVGAATVTCTLWLLGKNFGCLAAFSLLYGLLAGGYNVLYARFVTVLSDDPATCLWLYGLLAFDRGLGYVIAGPTSSALLHLKSAVAMGGSAQYRILILFVGAMFFVSALGALGWIWTRRIKVGSVDPAIEVERTVG